MYLILSIVTGIYLILSSVRDLKERMIYSFPAIVLTLAWGTYSVELYENEYGFLLGAWIATVVLWFLFRRFSIWGEGDNDVFLLFAGVLLCTLRFRTVPFLIFAASNLLALTQIGAVIVSLIEARVKKEKVTSQSKIAVVPGLCIVILGIMLYGICVRMGVIA